MLALPVRSRSLVEVRQKTIQQTEGESLWNELLGGELVSHVKLGVYWWGAQRTIALNKAHTTAVLTYFIIDCNTAKHKASLGTHILILSGSWWKYALYQGGLLWWRSFTASFVKIYLWAFQVILVRDRQKHPHTPTQIRKHNLPQLHWQWWKLCNIFLCGSRAEHCLNAKTFTNRI